MRKKHIALYALGGISALVAIAIVVIVSVDFGQYKSRIESAVTDTLGREFRLDGDLHINVGSSVEIYAEDVFLANPDWADSEIFFAARKVDVAVDFWSLIKGPVHISHLEVDGIRVNIEINAAGEASWDFATASPAPVDDGTQNSVREELPGILKNALITDTYITYRSAALGSPIVFFSESLVTSFEDDRQRVEIDGSLNGTQLQFVMTSGPVKNLIDFTDVTVEVAGNIGEIRVTGSSWIDKLSAPSRPQVMLEIEGPNASYLTDLLSLRSVTTGPLQLSVLMEDSGEYMTASFVGAYGEFEFDVKGQFKDLQSLQDMEIEFAMHGPDIGTLIRLAGREYAELNAFDVNGRIHRSGTEVTIDNILLNIGDSQLAIDGYFAEFPRPKGGHLSIEASGPELGHFNRLFGMPGRLGGAFTVSLDLIPNGDGRAQIDLAAESPDIKIQLNGLFGFANNFEGTTLDLEISGPAIETMIGKSERLPKGKYFLRGGVEKQGERLHLRDLQAAIGEEEEYQLQLSGFLIPHSGFVGSEISVQAQGASTAALAAIAGQQGVPDSPFDLSATIRRGSSNTFIERGVIKSDMAVIEIDGHVGPWPTLSGTRLAVELSGQDLSALVDTDSADSFLAHEFSASGIVFVNDVELVVEDFSASLENATMSADIAFSLDPLFANGRFNARVDSPDILQMLPPARNMSEAQSAVFAYRGSGEWADNYWKLGDSSLQIGEGQFKISGSLDGPPSFERTDLRVEWISPSIRNLSLIVGKELPDQAITFKARLIGTRDVMRTEEFELTLGESDLRGQLIIRDSEIPRIEIAMQSQLLDIAEFLADPDETTTAETGSADEKVIPDMLLPLAFMRSIEFDVDFKIGEFRTRSRRFLGAELDASLVDGALRVENLSYESLRGGFFKLAADLIPNASNGADLSLEANAEDLVLAFIAISEDDVSRLPLMGGTVELTGHGATLRDIAGSLDGYVRIVGGPGLVPPTAFSFLANDFASELVSKVNPFVESDAYTDVECAVVLLQIDDGTIHGSPAFVQQTDKLRIFANTTIDLGSEKVDADFEIIPQKGLGVSVSSLVNPYVRLSGTLAEPSLVVNPNDVIIQGGVAVATAGLSILAKTIKDRFLSEKDPCGKALSEADAIWAEQYALE